MWEMHMRMPYIFAAAASVALTLFSSPSAAELIRSDLPLWAGFEDGIEPFPYSAESRIGFATHFSLGDWRWTYSDCQGESCTKWIRVDLASVFHGGFSWQESDDGEHFSSQSREIALIIPLGATQIGSELYVIQIGARGGSEYLLASIENPDAPILRSMLILDPECTEETDNVEIREGDSVASILTRYCVVTSRETLRQLAEEALARPPQATFERVRAVEEN
jgi:hypothetical protein